MKQQNYFRVFSLLIVIIFVSLASGQVQVNFNVSLNEQAHHTRDYKVRNDVDPNDSARMIVRRGASFTISVALKTLYSFSLIAFDPVTTEKTSNAISVSLVQKYSPSSQWQATYVQLSSSIQYTIYIPSTSQTGIFYWGLVSPTGSITMLTNELVVLFNPWCTTDQVYYSKTADLSEYISNTQTLIWLGSTNRMSQTGWVYDQFHYDVLEVSIYFLMQLSWQSRGDAVLVSRHLSSCINANNNDGLVWGRWQEPYTGGRTPTYWTGSLEIFQQYRKVQQGVKYGQCWVFGGCLTTAGRSLGIPARTISNFDSAHEEKNDQDSYNNQIDVFLDSQGQYLSMGGGSIWNFHVWCEFWLARSDVANANGWQVVDATPQETSDSLFQLGPAPIASIKAKNAVAPYDANFVISEVGCGVYQWIQYNTGKEKHPYKPGFWLLDIEQNPTGHMMSTKSIGSLTRQDITGNYKTVGSSHFGFGQQKYTDSNVTFEIIAPPIVNIGDNITLQFTASCSLCTPTSGNMLQVAGEIRMISYTGDPIAILENVLGNVTIEGPQTLRELVLTRDNYQMYLGMNRLVEYNAFIKYFENGVFTGQYASRQGRIAFASPLLNLVPILSGNYSEFFLLNVTWKNPLSIPLNDVLLRISGAYIDEYDMTIGTIEGDGVVEDVLNINHFTPQGENIVVFVKLVMDGLSPVNGRVDIPNN